MFAFVAVARFLEWPTWASSRVRPTRRRTAFWRPRAAPQNRRPRGGARHSFTSSPRRREVGTSLMLRRNHPIYRSSSLIASRIQLLMNFASSLEGGERSRLSMPAVSAFANNCSSSLGISDVWIPLLMWSDFQRARNWWRVMGLAPSAP